MRGLGISDNLCYPALIINITGWLLKCEKLKIINFFNLRFTLNLKIKIDRQLYMKSKEKNWKKIHNAVNKSYEECSTGAGN